MKFRLMRNGKRYLVKADSRAEAVWKLQEMLAPKPNPDTVEITLVVREAGRRPRFVKVIGKDREDVKQKALHILGR